MKISNSKKFTAILSVMLSIFMVFTSISVTAFADLVSEDACFELVLDGTQAKLYAKNCQNLASGNLEFKFDKNVVSRISSYSYGKDAIHTIFYFSKTNEFFHMCNTQDVTRIIYGFYFGDTLWSTEKFAQKDTTGEANINGEYFHLATFDLTLADGKTEDDIQVSFSGSVEFADGITKEKPENFSMNVVKKSSTEEPTTEEPTTEEPTTEEPTTEEPKKDDSTNSADKTPKIVLKSTVGDTVKVQAIAKNYSDLKIADWVLSYDSSVLEFVDSGYIIGTGDRNQISTDVIALARLNSGFVLEYNPSNDGEIKIGFYFKEKLGTNDDTVLFTLEFNIVGEAQNAIVKLENEDGLIDSIDIFDVEAGLSACRHDNAKTINATAATCVSTGFTAGVYCEHVQHGFRDTKKSLLIHPHM